MTDSITVAIKIPFQPGGGIGGHEHLVKGLVSALSSLNNSNEQYVLVMNRQYPDWLSKYTGDNIEITTKPPSGSVERIRDMLYPYGEYLKPIARPLLSWSTQPNVSDADGYYESIGADVVHFITQVPFEHTALPCLYHPHDLQHLHYPEFFTARERNHREVHYQTGCTSADVVPVGSEWVKNDVINQYGIDPEKIYSIPHGPPTEAYDPVSEDQKKTTRNKFNLSAEYAFYPAQTWPHKNHKRLLEALAKLRDERGLIVNLICTGKKNEHWSEIKSKINELDLEDQVSFLGFVSAAELRAIYELSTFVVLPTLFEGASLVLLEAWQEGCPIACSTATSNPELAGDGAVLFDPESTEEMADAVARMSTDKKLREQIRKAGIERSEKFSWDRSARLYRAVYRDLAGCSLTEQDTKLLKQAQSDQLFE